jgi:hypothetical protein
MRDNGLRDLARDDRHLSRRVSATRRGGDLLRKDTPKTGFVSQDETRGHDKRGAASAGQRSSRDKIAVQAAERPMFRRARPRPWWRGVTDVDDRCTGCQGRRPAACPRVSAGRTNVRSEPPADHDSGLRTHPHRSPGICCLRATGRITPGVLVRARDICALGLAGRRGSMAACPASPRSVVRNAGSGSASGVRQKRPPRPVSRGLFYLDTGR